MQAFPVDEKSGIYNWKERGNEMQITFINRIFAVRAFAIYVLFKNLYILFMLLREYYKPQEVCLGCMFYFRHMKRYDVPSIIKAYGLRDEEYQYGQKACIKNKNFTYFNNSCMSFTKNPGTNLLTGTAKA